jgi:mannose-6-phosphate isomerase-like protein (cupin superfamily)
MAGVVERGLPEEQFGVFGVTQVTRGTALEQFVAVDLVRVEPGRTSEVHRHNQAETVLLILDGAGFVRVGDAVLAVTRGDRLTIGKGVFHGVRTEAEPLAFLSVQSPPILVKGEDRLDLEPLVEGP